MSASAHHCAGHYRRVKNNITGHRRGSVFVNDVFRRADVEGYSQIRNAASVQVVVVYFFHLRIQWSLDKLMANHVYEHFIAFLILSFHDISRSRSYHFHGWSCTLRFTFRWKLQRMDSVVFACSGIWLCIQFLHY
mmetsp:Transcript_77861/g.209822  ORF Transcript_77861/g.209822 Transcript_77861/m.209822 type:complete len:135 (+) Transcript_77861:196-600(+)